MRTRLAGGVLAALLLGCTLPASASSPARPALLRGSITLSGSTSYMREFVLTSPFRFTAGNRTIRTEGGRYSGFVLRKVGDDPTPTVASIAPGFCVARGCRRPAWSGTYVMNLFTGFPLAPNENPDFAPLTPGRYRVYLVADGKPVSVTLKLPGSGRVTYTSGTRTATPIHVPEAATWAPETPAGGMGSMYSAGSTHRTSAPSVYHFMSSWKFLYGPPKSVNQQGVCDYQGPPATGTLGRYQYPCAGPLGFFAFGQLPTGRKAGPAGTLDEYVATTEYFGVGEVADQRSIGGFINGGSPATSAHTTVLWVDLR